MYKEKILITTIMKKILMMVLMAGIALSTNAQWNNWHTTQVISGGVGILGSIIASSERKKAYEIFEREKAQYQPTFEKVYNEAKSLSRKRNGQTHSTNTRRQPN